MFPETCQDTPLRNLPLVVSGDLRRGLCDYYLGYDFLHSFDVLALGRLTEILATLALIFNWLATVLEE